MAFVPNVNYDVFISYATANNQSFSEGEHGWVTSFRDALKLELDERLNRRSASEVWMDYRLRGNEPFDEQLRAVPASSATMIVVLSSAYLASTWCCKELSLFAASIATDSWGGAGRIFLVHYEPVPIELWPDQLSGLSAEFYTFNSSPRDGAVSSPLGHPIPNPNNSNHAPFYRRVRELSKDLADKLKLMRSPVTNAIASKVNPPDPRPEGNESESEELQKLLASVRPSQELIPRDELMEQTLSQLQDGALPVVVLQGLEGIGKTVLLTQIVPKARTAGFRLLALSFDGPAASEPGYVLDEVNRFLVSAGRGLHRDELTRQQPERILAVLGHQLQTLGIKILVLLDRADGAMPEWLESICRCLAHPPYVRLLATSRNRLGGVDGTHLTVPPFDDQQALALVIGYKRQFHLDVDPAILIKSLPRSVSSHPEALVTLLAQLADFPLDVLLAWGMPDAVHAPSRVIGEVIRRLSVPTLEALALTSLLSGLELFKTATLLRLVPPREFVDGLKSLLQRSLIYRSADTYFVPAMVADAVRTVASDVLNAAAMRVIASWKELVQGPRLEHVEKDSLAKIGTRLLNQLESFGYQRDLLDLIPDRLLDDLNAWGYWKEYSFVLQLGVRSATALSKPEAQFHFGLRLARKLLQMGNLEGAREEVERAEQLFDCTTDTLEAAEIHSHRALICQFSTNSGEMLTELLESRRIRTAVADHAGLAIVQKLIGNFYLRTNNCRLARESLQLAVEMMTDRPQDKHALEARLSLIACEIQIENDQGRDERNWHGIQHSLQQLETDNVKAGFSVLLSRVWLYRSLVEEKLDRIESALKYAQMAVNAARETDLGTFRVSETIVRRLTRASSGKLEG